MYIKQIIATLVLALSVSACYGGGATSIGSYQPVVDTQNSQAAYNGRNYSDDLAQCQQLGQQRNPFEQGAVTALGGAAVGAAGGAIIGAFTGNPGMGAGLGAAIGGLGGATAGGYGGVQSQEQIVSSCMSNRGWAVLAK